MKQTAVEWFAKEVLRSRQLGFISNEKFNELLEQAKDKWSEDNWYFLPTFCYHKEWKILTFHFLKFTFEICF